MITGKITTGGVIWKTGKVELTTNRTDNGQKARLRNINIYYQVVGSDIVNNVITDGDSGNASEYKLTFSIPTERLTIYWSAQEYYYKRTTGTGTNYDNFFYNNFTGSGARNGQNSTGANNTITANDTYLKQFATGHTTRQLNCTIGSTTTNLASWWVKAKDKKGNRTGPYPTSPPASMFLRFDVMSTRSGEIILCRDTNKNGKARVRAYVRNMSNNQYYIGGKILESGAGATANLELKFYLNRKTDNARITEIDPAGNSNEAIRASYSSATNQFKITLYNDANLTDPVESVTTYSYAWTLDSTNYNGNLTISQGADSDDEATDNVDENGNPIPPTDPRYVISYAYIINVAQFGIRFKQYGEPTSIKKDVSREIATNIKVINTENNPLPEYYDPNNGFTVEEPIDLTIFTADQVKGNRLQYLAKEKLIYIYIPESWGLRIESGFYVYDSYGFNADIGDHIFNIKFNGLKKVQATGIPTDPTDWTYDTLANFSASLNSEGDTQLTYKTLLKFWSNYNDLADNF